MTDRQPDDLYDALCDRLADYGQEPPAPLWANIRAQLPPPVATPRRARRRALAALALLLLLGLGTLQWWPPGGRPIPQVATALPRPAASQPAAAPECTAPAPALPPMPRVAADALAPAETHSSAAIAAATAAGAPAATASKAAATPGKPAATIGRLAAAAGTVAANRPAATGAALAAALHAEPAAATVAVAPAAATATTTDVPTTTAAASIAARQQAAVYQWQPRAGAGQEAGAGRPHSIATRASAPLAPAITHSDTSTSENPLPAAQLLTAGRAAASSMGNGAGARPAAGADGAQQLASTPGKTRTQTTRGLPPRAATPTAAAGYPMLPQVAALQLPVQAPAVLARADTLPPQPTAVRRWAVQALAGPGISSRALGSQRLHNASSPVFSNNPARDVSGMPEEEQAAASFGTEAQLQRQLTGRWSLGTGLGYQAFATSQAVKVRVVHGPTPTNTTPVSNFIADSVSTVSVRNTYHFLTLPLRVGYQLGTGSARLRYGLRAGADVALYLGGRSTEDGTPGSLGRNSSPYHPLSLALSLGAEVRYQLAPGWELLAQPTLTHFVTSVARPAAGYAPRYPVAATVLVGVAYWLR